MCNDSAQSGEGHVVETAIWRRTWARHDAGYILVDFEEGGVFKVDACDKDQLRRVMA